MSDALHAVTDPEMAEYLSNELNQTFTNEVKREVKAVSVSVPSSSSEQASTSPKAEDEVARWPRRINGGFQGLRDDLDQHSRSWRNAARLLEQLRPQMEAAEAERDRLQAALDRIVPEVDESHKSLSSIIERAKAGDISGDLGARFTRSLTKLDELESIAEALTANHLALRSIWEQYARTVLQAQRLRETFRGS
jgi:chromosome segregation ATPase